MAIDTKQILRDGTVNLTATETNPAATRSQGPISLATGLPRKGVWFKAYFKTDFTGTSAVNTVHSTTPPTGGTWGLTIGNKSIAASVLAFNASTATVQAAIVALATAASPLVINGVAYTSLVGGTDITVSGGAISAGDMVFTFAGVLKYQPILIVGSFASLTGNTATVVQSTTAGSQIDIQPTDGTNALPYHIYLDGAVPTMKEVAVLLETGHNRLVAGQPETVLNYVATVAGTITVAPVVIYLDDTMGGMN
jgi:hypothetical protein